MHHAVSLLALLLLLSPAHAADWELPPVSTAISQADAILIAKVTARTPDGKSERWDIQVDETLKGKTEPQLTVHQIDLGDPQGETSPFPPIPDLGTRRVVLFLKQGKETTALSRYLVDANTVAFLGEPENQKWSLADLRAAVTQLALLQSAARTPELAPAAYRIALQSKIDEVVWWGASNLLRQNIPATAKPELTAALQSAPEKGKARKVLEQCLRKAGGNSP